MSSKENQFSKATPEKKIQITTKKQSEDEANIEVSEYKNSEEDRNENASEEGNDFVVDLGNTTPVKGAKTFQFDERSDNNLNQYLDDDNDANNPEFHEIQNNNLISAQEIGSGFKNDEEEEKQQENLVALDKILDDDDAAAKGNAQQLDGIHEAVVVAEDFEKDKNPEANLKNNNETADLSLNSNEIRTSNNNYSANLEKDPKAKNDLAKSHEIKSNEQEENAISQDNQLVNVKTETPIEKIISTSEAPKATNIPILNKLKSSTENINENDSKPNVSDNNNNNYGIDNLATNSLQNQPQNSKVLNNSPILINQMKRVSNSDIEQNLKFEKLLNTNLDAKHQFRICIVGDSNVGKTSLLLRYCDNTFKSTMTNTIGVDFRSLMLKYNETNIKLQIWDTAGQERFKSISVNYFKSANGFIFVYDIANRITFENLNHWFDIVSQHNKNSICNFVVGNKCDLDNRRQVSIEEGRDLAFSKKFNFMETSAKSAKNVDMAFEIFTIKLMEFFNLDNNSESNIGDDNSSSYSIDDGKKFKIDEDEKEDRKNKKKKGCKC